MTDKPVWLPKFSRRVSALWIDFAALIALYLAWIVSLPLLFELHPALRVASLVAPMLLLEPMLVAYSGGSIGHHAMGLRVRDVRADSRLGFARACLRAALKTVLGWMSLAFALFGHRSQALHDAWSRSVVVVASVDRVPASERTPWSAGEPAEVATASVARRCAVIVGWWLGMTLAFLLVVGVLVVSQCTAAAVCGPVAAVLLVCAQAVWAAAMATIPALGWFGKLYGARGVRTTGG